MQRRGHRHAHVRLSRAVLERRAAIAEMLVGEFQADALAEDDDGCTPLGEDNFAELVAKGVPRFVQLEARLRELDAANKK